MEKLALEAAEKRKCYKNHGRRLPLQNMKSSARKKILYIVASFAKSVVPFLQGSFPHIRAEEAFHLCVFWHGAKKHLIPYGRAKNPVTYDDRKKKGKLRNWFEKMVFIPLYIPQNTCNYEVE